MQNALSIDEYDLAGFFGSEPKLLDPGERWNYNDAVYEAKDGHTHLSFALAPAGRDVRILLSLGELVVYELNASGVVDVRLHDDNGRQSLEIMIAERQSLWVRLKPTIAIVQTVSDRP